MNDQGPRQTPSPVWLSSDTPLTDEDSTDIFFSFDITSLAFLWEHEHGYADDMALARITIQERAGDLSGIGGLIWAGVGDCLKSPVNYGYLLLAALVALMALNLRPVHESAIERITAMLAPDMAVPKPPPPHRRKPLEEEKPEQKVTRDKPPEEKIMEKIAKPERKQEPPPNKALVKHQRRADPLKDQKLQVSKQEQRNPLDTPRLQVNSKSRTEAPSTGQFKVTAARRGDAPADIPKAFAKARNGPAGEIAPAKLSKVGVEPRRRTPEPDENRQLNVKSVKRDEPANVDEEAINRNTAGPDSLPINLREEEDLRGVWQRIENIGPLAQLNALCYGKRSGEIIYKNSYRLKCSNNQIIEAWRRKSGM